MIKEDLYLEIQEESRNVLKDIVLKQTIKYFVWDNIFKIIFIVLAWSFLNQYNFYIKLVIGIITVFILMKLIYNFFYFVNLKYTITDQQIIIETGVLIKTTNYMELYRIYDYAKQQSLFGRFINLMNITLLSRDSTTPKLFIKGIKNNAFLIDEIRRRVEFNKKLKSILELNNTQ